MEKSTCTQRIVNDNTQQLISPVKAGYIERLDEKIFIKKGLNIIGREHYCHIVIPHEALSSKHGLIYVEDTEKHFVCDLKSTNGTKVNDELIANNAFHPLNDGDTVSFGGYEFIYFKLADGIGGVLDRSADDIQTTATQATENNDTNPLDDSFEFPSASEVDGIFEGSTNNFTIPETPPNQSTPKNLLMNQTTESRASTSFMTTEEESSLKNNSEASFNLMLEETYNSDTMLINCSDKETTELVVDDPVIEQECPEPVKEIQHNDLSSETIEKTKPNEPPGEVDAGTLLINGDVLNEKEKNQTSIENLCTQVCDDQVSNIYAGVPQQSIGLMDETMIVGQEDSKEKVSFESKKESSPALEKDTENVNEIEMSPKDLSTLDGENANSQENDLCSLPPTQILPRNLNVKRSTRNLIKETEPSNHISNCHNTNQIVENCKPNDPHDELEEDTLLINEEILTEAGKKQTSIENLCTQVCEDQVSNVYAGVPQQLDGLMDETMIVGQEDSKEKVSNESRKESSPALEKQTENVKEMSPKVLSTLDGENANSQENDLCSLPPTQILPRNVNVKRSTRNLIKETEPSKHISNCHNTNQIVESCKPNDPHDELEENTLLINEEILTEAGKKQTSIENLCTQVCEDQVSNVYAGVPQQLDGLMDETMIVGQEDSKEKVSFESKKESSPALEKQTENVKEMSPKVLSTLDGENANSQENDLCSLPPTQILPRNLNVKVSTRKLLKETESSKNLPNAFTNGHNTNQIVENCKPNDPHDELEEDTLLINEEILTEAGKEQSSIENLCTQVCEDQVSNVYAGVPQQLDGLMDETMIVSQKDSKEKVSFESKKVSSPGLEKDTENVNEMSPNVLSTLDGENANSQENDLCSLPPTQILPRNLNVKRSTRNLIKETEPSKHISNCQNTNQIVENCKPSDPHDELEEDTLLINEEILTEAGKEQTSIENLCTQVCEDQVSNVYAGVPQQLDGLMDETMIVGQEDETTEIPSIAKNNSISVENLCTQNCDNQTSNAYAGVPQQSVGVMDETMLLGQEDDKESRKDESPLGVQKCIENSVPSNGMAKQVNHSSSHEENAENDSCSLLPTQIFPRNFPVKRCPRKPYKHKMNTNTVHKPIHEESSVDMNAETLVIHEENHNETDKGPGKTVENPTTIDEICVSSSDDEDISLLKEDLFSLPATQILERDHPVKRCTRKLIKPIEPSKNLSNSEKNSDNIVVADKPVTNIEDLGSSTDEDLCSLPPTQILQRDHPVKRCTRKLIKPIESKKFSNSEKNGDNIVAADKPSVTNIEDLGSSTDEDLCSLPPTQILQRDHPVKRCTRKLIKPIESKKISNSEKNGDNIVAADKQSVTNIEDLGSSTDEDFFPDDMVLDTSLTPNQSICNDKSVSSIKKTPKTVVDDFKSDLVTQAVCSKQIPKGTGHQVLSSIGKCNNLVSPPVESISQIQDFLSENRICVPSSSKTITTEVEDVKNDLLTQEHFISKNKICVPSSSYKMNTEVEDVKNDLLTQGLFVKPNVPSKRKSSSVIGSRSESSVETMSQIQDFISKDPSSRKQTNNEVEDLKNDLLTQPIFLKPFPASTQIKTSSVNTPREFCADEIPLSHLKTVETMSQIKDFVLKNESRAWKEENCSKKKETEVEDLKNDLSTQALCSNPQQTAPSVIESPIETDEIPGSPGRVESISQIQQFVSRGKTRSSSSPKKRESVAEARVECETNSKPKRTRAPSWKMKLANDTSKQDNEKPAPRRGRPKKICLDDDDDYEIEDSSPEVIITKKTSRLMETKPETTSRKSADNRRGKRKAEDRVVNTKESGSSGSVSNSASTSKYPKLEVTKSTVPATTDDMDLDIADMIKMRKRSASIRPGSLNPSEMNQFRHQNVIFTFLKSVELQNKVKKLGGTIGTSPTDCTVLVAEEVKRSVKFLCVLGLGKPIVTPKWIHDSFESNFFLDPMKYVLKDRKKETLFQFQLEKSIKTAKESPLLKSYSIFVTPSVKPPPSGMKDIIESCGGRFLPKAPLKWPNNTIVISCCDDEIIYKKWKSRGKTFPIIDAEGLITGILQQNLRVEQHLL